MKEVVCMRKKEEMSLICLFDATRRTHAQLLPTFHAVRRRESAICLPKDDVKANETYRMLFQPRRNFSRTIEVVPLRGDRLVENDAPEVRQRTSLLVRSLLGWNRRIRTQNTSQKSSFREERQRKKRTKLGNALERCCPEMKSLEPSSFL